MCRAAGEAEPEAVRRLVKGAAVDDVEGDEVDGRDNGA